MNIPDFINPTETPRTAELEAQGFMRRTTATEPRLSELVDQYREIGHDVEIVEFKPETNGCSVCFSPQPDCAGAQLKKSKYEAKKPDVYFDIFVRTKSGK